MSSGNEIYSLWNTFLGWMQEYSHNNPQTQYKKVSDFADYIYRMERQYDIVTTTGSAAIERDGQTLLLASVSPRHVQDKGISLRLMGGMKHWHLHAHDGHLYEGKRAFGKERLFELLDKSQYSLKAS